MIPRLTIDRSAALLAMTALVISAGCAHRPSTAGASSTAPAGSPSSAPAAAASAPYVAPTHMAFAFDARVLVEDVVSRKMKMRFYGQAPDRFRIEVRGPVGPIALVATGRGGKVRFVVPSRRRYAEATMDTDLAAGLLGVPMTACDLAMIVRISAGFKKFHPCGGETPGEDAPLTETDRPGLIVDANPQGGEMVRFGWDWSEGRAEGTFPKEMRVESLSPPQTSLALTGFKAIDEPSAPGEDFFWEPLPEGATLVSIEELGGDVER